MAKLKAAVRTIGDHKQRITVNVSIEGIKIIDEKTEVYLIFDCVHFFVLGKCQKFSWRWMSMQFFSRDIAMWM